MLLKITWLLLLLETDIPCTDNFNLESSLAQVKAQLHFTVLRTCNIRKCDKVDVKTRNPSKDYY